MQQRLAITSPAASVEDTRWLNTHPVQTLRHALRHLLIQQHGGGTLHLGLRCRSRRTPVLRGAIKPAP